MHPAASDRYRVLRDGHVIATAANERLAVSLASRLGGIVFDAYAANQTDQPEEGNHADDSQSE